MVYKKLEKCEFIKNCISDLIEQVKSGMLVIDEIKVYDEDDTRVVDGYVSESNNIMIGFDTEDDFEWLNKRFKDFYNQSNYDFKRTGLWYSQRTNTNHCDLIVYNTNYYGVCDDCGEIVKYDELTTVSGGDQVCDSCLEDKYSYCERCGEYHPSSKFREVCTSRNYRRGGWDTEFWCDECVDDNAFQCESCGNWFSDDVDYRLYDGDMYCQECFDDEFVECEQCGVVIRRDDAYWDEDREEYLCDSCYNDRQEENREGAIRSYHNNPARQFHRMSDEPDENRFIGCEIETEYGDVYERKRITTEYGEDEKYIYMMHDGSLNNDGIENITQPMTKRFFDQFAFGDWFHDLIAAGARSHDADNCGLHVHLSREWMDTDDRDKQDEYVGRMRQFIADNKEQVERFARRHEVHWCKYKKAFEDKEAEQSTMTKEQISKKYKDSASGYAHNDRYVSVNNTNSATIEFRIFKGTLIVETFRASVEFCLRVVDYITSHDEKESWDDFLTYKPLPDVMKSYLIRRNLLTE